VGPHNKHCDVHVLGILNLHSQFTQQRIKKLWWEITIHHVFLVSSKISGISTVRVGKRQLSVLSRLINRVFR
jgi:hypothetical protein